MALLTVTKLVSAGVVSATAAAAAGGGDTCPVDDHTWLAVFNGHSSAQVVTIVAQRPCPDGTLHNIVVSVPNASNRLIPLVGGARIFQNASAVASITYSGVIALTIAVYSNANAI